MAFVNHLTPASNAFPDYFWRGCLGSGSFGAVHEYCQMHGGSRVAVKINQATQDAYYFALAELHVLNEIRDVPHIARLEKYQQLGPLQFAIFLELAPGKNLQQYLDNFYVFKPAQILLITRSVLFALEHLESLKIATGDLKPDNLVFCDQTNSIKLVDWGNAISLKQFASHSGSEYPFGYTLFYRPPEFFFAKPYTTTVDIWAYGTTLAHLCLGRPLFYAGLEYEVRSDKMAKHNFTVYTNMLNQFWLFCGPPPAGFLDDSKDNPFFVLDPSTNRPCKFIEPPTPNPLHSNSYDPQLLQNQFVQRMGADANAMPVVDGIHSLIVKMLQWDNRPSPNELLMLLAKIQ